MKKFSISTLILFTVILANAQHGKNSGANCDLGIVINSNFPRASALDSIMNVYTTNLLPGVSIAVYSEAGGWWAGAKGYASIENKIPMQNCHLQYIQSISKTYLAVEILQLKEQGKIDLDAAMTKYLPSRYSQYIKNAEKITIRMLLNHRTGVPEYNQDAEFISQVILHPLKDFSSEDCLKAIAGKDLQFSPGSKYQYANTNYLLLSLIGDAITGDHAAYMKKNIFSRLDLNNSYYGKDHSYLNGLNLPQSYWDVFNAGIPVNITPFQKMTVTCSKGDDGIVCTTTDAVKFFKGLMEGKLLKPESLKEMLDFVKDEKGHNRYGMGITYFDLGGLPAYGHGGGGIGAGCGLVYIPSHKIYVFLSTNLGVFVEGNLSKKAEEFRDAVLMALLM
jgi:D-alanyl-D-alanine carboxypeptidase